MKKVLNLLIIGFMAFSLAACTTVTQQDKDIDPNENQDEVDSSFRLLVSDLPADIADFEYLNIPILKTRIFSVVNGSESFVEADINFTVDLTQLIGAASIEVLEIDLEPGSYTKIELFVDQPNIKSVMVSGDKAEVFVPSGKLMIDNDFDIVEGEQITFVFDINIVKKGQKAEYNLTPVISESGVLGEDLDESEVEEVKMVFVSEETSQNLSVYALEDTIPNDILEYITAESLEDNNQNKVVVMSFINDEWKEKSIMISEPEDVINDTLEDGKEYVWVILSEDNSEGTLYRIIWLEEK